MGPIQDRDIGAVGAKLLDFWSGRIRHAGMVFEADGEARNLFAGMEEGVGEPFGSDRWYRDVLAVSGACFSIRRDVFLRAGDSTLCRSTPGWISTSVSGCAWRQGSGLCATRLPG